jgi:hypothetical protein
MTGLKTQPSDGKISLKVWPIEIYQAFDAVEGGNIHTSASEWRADQSVFTESHIRMLKAKNPTGRSTAIAPDLDEHTSEIRLNISDLAEHMHGAPPRRKWVSDFDNFISKTLGRNGQPPAMPPPTKPPPAKPSPGRRNNSPGR